jgi:hypothetical protein
VATNQVPKRTTIVFFFLAGGIFVGELAGVQLPTLL